MKKFFDEFKAFAMRGNVVDMAIGVIIGGAFGKITTSLVNDIFIPLLGSIPGGGNYAGLFYALDGNQYASIEAATEAGVGTINYGAFVQYIIDFVLVAFCMFLVIKLMNGLKKKEEEPAPAPAKEPRLCPYCRMEIPEDATRCGHCTSVLDK